MSTDRSSTEKLSLYEEACARAAAVLADVPNAGATAEWISLCATGAAEITSVDTFRKNLKLLGQHTPPLERPARVGNTSFNAGVPGQYVINAAMRLHEQDDAIRSDLAATVLDLPNAAVDRHLEAVLKASGSALRHYSMQKTIDDMRAALRQAITGEMNKLLAADRLSIAIAASRSGLAEGAAAKGVPT